MKKRLTAEQMLIIDGLKKFSRKKCPFRRAGARRRKS
ncbi:Uncharacterised protein [Burkholderia pseudomallei]|nr:Uncharacterised protein [Burkholderia pseudomallei]